MNNLEYKVINEMPKSFEELMKYATRDTVIKIRGKSLFFINSKDLTDSWSGPIMVGNLVQPMDGANLRIGADVLTQIWRMFNSHYGIWGSTEFAYLCEHMPKKDTQKTRELLRLLRAELARKKAARTFNKRTDIPEIGVELELESDDGSVMRSKASDIMRRTARGLFDSVVSDGSVKGGTEIRFEHPTLKYWDKEQITKALTGLTEAGFFTDHGTAGMHIHLSFAKRELTKKATERFVGALQDMQKILYPICARQLCVRGRERGDVTDRYGLGKNITRGFTGHGTLEIRVWQATTNPKVFMARVKFADYLIRFLASDTPIERFFKNMTKAQKENYAFLVKTENPHVFGVGEKAALEMLYK